MDRLGLTHVQLSHDVKEKSSKQVCQIVQLELENTQAVSELQNTSLLPYMLQQAHSCV